MKPATLEEVNQTLVAARLLLSDPSSWTKRATYRTDAGVETGSLARACKFCAGGAVLASHSPATSEAFQALRLSNELLNGNPGYVAFNDHPNTTHKEVLELFDLAITLTEPTT